MKCKFCGKKNHYCSSCDYDMYLYEGYCNKECFEMSGNFKEFNHLIKKFMSSLSEEQKLDFKVLWDNDFLTGDLFENYLDKIITRIDDRKE